jgi:hypothetical protein
MSTRRRLRCKREELELFPGPTKDTVVRPSFGMAPAPRAHIKLTALGSLSTLADVLRPALHANFLNLGTAS